MKGSRNGPFSFGFDEIFDSENRKMAAGMVLFRSDFVEFFSRNGNFSIGFDGFFTVKKC